MQKELRILEPSHTAQVGWTFGPWPKGQVFLDQYLFGAAQVKGAIG